MANTFKQSPFGGMWLDDNGNPAKGPSAGSAVPGGGQFGQVNAPQSTATSLNPTASAVATQSAGAADPFASQRGQYQGQLSQLMGGLGGNQVSQDIQSMRSQSQQQPGGRYAGMIVGLERLKGS